MIDARTGTSAKGRRGSPKVQKVVTLIHILSASVCFGAVIIAVSLTVRALLGSRDGFANGVKDVLWIYPRIVMPMGVITILVGLYYGFLSRWGFAKHRWVLVKWILFALVAPCIALTVGRIRSLLNANTFGWQQTVPLLILITAQVLILLVIMVLSVYKPRLRRSA